MLITRRIDEELLREAKQLAGHTGKSLNGVIEDALRELLACQRLAATHAPVHLITVGGTGVHPGAGLDDSASLLDIMGAPSDRN